MRQSKAWIVQAESDLIAAQRVHKESEIGTYCQAIAKYQQCVEKSVKAMVAAINELGIPFHAISRNHNPVREIDALRGMKRVVSKAIINNIGEYFRTSKEARSTRCAISRQPFQLPVTLFREIRNIRTKAAALGQLQHRKVRSVCRKYTRLTNSPGFSINRLTVS
jgi:hypothetical protein